MTALISISVKTRFLHSAKFDMFIEFDMHLNSLLTKVSKKKEKKKRLFHLAQNSILLFVREQFPNIQCTDSFNASSHKYAVTRTITNTLTYINTHNHTYILTNTQSHTHLQTHNHTHTHKHTHKNTYRNTHYYNDTHFTFPRPQTLTHFTFTASSSSPSSADTTPASSASQCRSCLARKALCNVGKRRELQE